MECISCVVSATDGNRILLAQATSGLMDDQLALIGEDLDNHMMVYIMNLSA
jgi:hypothetical protein